MEVEVPHIGNPMVVPPEFEVQENLVFTRSYSINGVVCTERVFPDFANQVVGERYVSSFTDRLLSDVPEHVIDVGIGRGEIALFADNNVRTIRRDIESNTFRTFDEMFTASNVSLGRFGDTFLRNGAESWVLGDDPLLTRYGPFAIPKDGPVALETRGLTVLRRKDGGGIYLETDGKVTPLLTTPFVPVAPLTESMVLLAESDASANPNFATTYHVFELQTENGPFRELWNFRSSLTYQRTLQTTLNGNPRPTFLFGSAAQTQAIVFSSLGDGSYRTFEFSADTKILGVVDSTLLVRRSGAFLTYSTK